MLKIKTSSPAGDLIAMLAGIKHLCETQNTKAIIYQRLNTPGIGYEGTIGLHPFKDSVGDEVMMNEYMFTMLKPLLDGQEYIESYEIYTGQDHEIDLDNVRMKTFTNQPLGSINRWLFYVYPQMACNLSHAWVFPKKLDVFGSSDVIAINFTFRYRNHLVDYSVLKKHKFIEFVGLPEEHERFCKQWGLDIPLRKFSNFRHLAVYLKSCKLFLGNQSFCYQLAESMKIPRILELSPVLPNVIPYGENGYDFYHQQALEYYLEKLSR
jgi:hypothetical protein